MSVCEGCRHLTEEPAGKGKKFFVCNVGGPMGWTPRRVVDVVPEWVREPHPIFHECKKRRSGNE